MWDTPPWKGVCNTRTCVRGYSRGGECGTLWQKKGTGPSPGGDCNGFATPVCWFDILPMFTFAAETTKDMKKHLVLLSAVLLVQTAVVSVFAQQKPKAGDLISGIVTDSVSPLMGVYITELDSREEPKGKHEYVDLGLSVKWATCNVGADKPEDYGDYYAWGELTPKESYTWENYRFRTSGDDEGTVKLSKYTSMIYTSVFDANIGNYIADNKTQLDPEDDVAHVKWGGDWRLPTNEEMNELIDSCTWTWTTVNGVNGCLVTSNRPGYNDRSIFLPATGKYGFETSNKSAGTWGHYWSNSVNKDQSSYNAGVLAIGSGYAAVKITFRAHGQSVRPVCP